MKTIKVIQMTEDQKSSYSYRITCDDDIWEGYTHADEPTRDVARDKLEELAAETEPKYVTMLATFGFEFDIDAAYIDFELVG